VSHAPVTVAYVLSRQHVPCTHGPFLPHLQTSRLTFLLVRAHATQICQMFKGIRILHSRLLAYILIPKRLLVERDKEKEMTDIIGCKLAPQEDEQSTSPKCINGLYKPNIRPAMNSQMPPTPHNPDHHHEPLSNMQQPYSVSRPLFMS